MDNGDITHITLHQRNSWTLKIYHFDGDINRILSIRWLTGSQLELQSEFPNHMF